MRIVSLNEGKLDPTHGVGINLIHRKLSYPELLTSNIKLFSGSTGLLHPIVKYKVCSFLGFDRFIRFLLCNYKMSFVSLTGFLVTLFTAFLSLASEPLVVTRFGPIQGFSDSYRFDSSEGSLTSLEYEAFLGIPFAEPPVGDKRFRSTIPLTPAWTHEFPYQATSFGKACIQSPEDVIKSYNTSEDCLFLNIWRPTRDQNDEQLLPVFYLAHGSGYVKLAGSAPQNIGDVMASNNKMIFVNSNYRLGAFGWAYGHDTLMPANNGLNDVLTVLRWIQDNIKAFGGDPDQVTLAGESAGAKIVSIITSLPEQWGVQSLFNKVLMISGVAVHQVHVESPSVGLAKTKLLATKANCSVSSDDLQLSEETVKCLRTVYAEKLLQAQGSPEINAIGSSEITVFLPVHGNQLIPGQPMVNHFGRLNFTRKLPMLFTSAYDEQSLFHSVEEVTTLQSAKDYVTDRVKYAVKNISQSQLDTLFSLYFTDADRTNSIDLRFRCIKFCTDMNYHCPSLMLAQFYSQNNDHIYFYRYRYVGEQLSRPYGTRHGDDQRFALGIPYRELTSFTLKDRIFSDLMMNVFNEFTKTGDLENWPRIKLDPNDLNALQLIKEMDLPPKDIVDQDQKVCLEWAKLFGYEIKLL